MEPDLESIEPRSRSSRWIWKPRSWKGVGGSMSINKYLYYYYYYFCDEKRIKGMMMEREVTKEQEMQLRMWEKSRKMGEDM